MLKRLTRTVWGLAMLGAVLSSLGPIVSARAQTAPADVGLLLSCEAPGAPGGTAEGSFGGRAFRLACDAAARPLDRSAIAGVDNPDDEPWRVTVTIPGKTCESSGSGLPMLVTCALSDSSDQAPVSFSLYSD
jgi:hypothetical protein